MNPLHGIMNGFLRHATCLRHSCNPIPNGPYSTYKHIVYHPLNSFSQRLYTNISQAPTRVLQLANLNPTTSYDSLQDIFRHFPGFKRLPVSRRPSPSVALIEFSSVSLAGRALETLRSSQPLIIEGQEVIASFADLPKLQLDEEESGLRSTLNQPKSEISKSVCLRFGVIANRSRTETMDMMKQLLGDVPGLKSLRQRTATTSSIWATYGSVGSATSAIEMIQSHPEFMHHVSAEYAHATRIRTVSTKRLLIQCDPQVTSDSVCRLVQGLDGNISCRQIREARNFQATRFIAEFCTIKAAVNAMDFMTSYPTPMSSILNVSFIHSWEVPPNHASNVLFIDNISLSTTQSELQRIFGSFKGFHRLMLKSTPRRAHLQRHDGWGYVEYTTVMAAEGARSATNGKSLRGSIIQVSFSEKHQSQDTITVAKPNQKYGPSGKGSPWSNTLFVKGLLEASLMDVEDAFKVFRGFDRALLLPDKTRASTPYCKILFKTVEDAMAALEKIRIRGGLRIGNGEGPVQVETLRLGSSPKDRGPENHHHSSCNLHLVQDK